MAAAIALVLVVGVALAVARPGNLGDHATSKAAATSTTAVTEAPSSTSTTPTTAPATTSTTAAPATSTPTPTTAAPASGLGASGAGSAGHRGLATTGGLPWALPGGVLLLAAIVTRRLARR